MALAAPLLLGMGLRGCGGESNPGETTAEAPRVDVVADEAARRVDVLVDGQPFTSYIFPADLKKPSLYPLRTAGGTLVTRGYPLDPRPGEPEDHPHHIGLWLNYGQVNGIDFWGNSSAMDSAWQAIRGTVRHSDIRSVESGPGEGSLEVAADWIGPSGDTLLREDTRYVFHADADLRAVDRITTLTALDTAVTFADTKEGMLGLRVARALQQPALEPVALAEQDGSTTTIPVADTSGVSGRYRSSEGLEGDSVWGTRARWVSLDGVVEGEPVTIAILDHPANPGYPTYWHARGYGLFAANPLGQKDFSEGAEELNLHLEQGESTTMRYRILILTGPDVTGRIEAQYIDFAN